jgi:hypothetical protein
MKYLFWLLAGVGLGFLVAHQVNRTDAGKAFFADVDSKARQLSDAVAAGYRERSSELRGGRS